MARSRLAVALLPPPLVAAELDVLRRAVGSSTLERIPAHLTLIPPVNVSEAELDPARDLLGAAASSCRPFRLHLGPAATFAPATPTLHLAVRGANEADTAALAALLAALRAGPFDRPEKRPFVAHVTLEQSMDRARVPGAVEALSGVDLACEVRSVHMLEHRRGGDGSARWWVVAEEPLGGPSVLGRGGVELDVRTLGMVDDAVADLCGVPPASPHPGAGRPAPLVVTARPGGSRPSDLPVAAVVGRCPSAVPSGTRKGSGHDRIGGSVAHLESVAVREGVRNLGIGRQVLAHWCSAAVDLGADLAVARLPSEPGPRQASAELLASQGWQAVGEHMVRSL